MEARRRSADGRGSDGEKFKAAEAAATAPFDQEASQ
jgi:hypothetical protein